MKSMLGIPQSSATYLSAFAKRYKIPVGNIDVTVGSVRGEKGYEIISSQLDGYNPEELVSEVMMSMNDEQLKEVILNGTGWSQPFVLAALVIMAIRKELTDLLLNEYSGDGLELEDPNTRYNTVMVEVAKRCGKTRW